MRLLALIRKEFIEIFRQKELLPLLFVAPLIQIVVLSHVVRTDIAHVPLAIEDRADDALSRGLIQKLRATPLFDLKTVSSKPLSAEELFRTNRAMALLTILPAKGSDRLPAHQPRLLIEVDGVDANTAAVAAGYLSGILRQHLGQNAPRPLVRGLPSDTLIRFNPDLQSINTMGPGIVALLLTIVTLFLTSVSLVREREQQTIDTLLISPLNPVEIYLGKALPLGLVGMVQMLMGLVVVKFWFAIPFRGSLLWLIACAAVFLCAILSLALLISTLARTQQQALFFSWFAMITFILLSGLFTPVESMAPAIEWVSRLNPLRYLIQVIRDILLKGNGWSAIRGDMAVLGAIALGLLSVSSLSFRRLIRR